MDQLLNLRTIFIKMEAIQSSILDSQDRFMLCKDCKQLPVLALVIAPICFMCYVKGEFYIIEEIT